MFNQNLFPYLSGRHSDRTPNTQLQKGVGPPPRLTDPTYADVGATVKTCTTDHYHWADHAALGTPAEERVPQARTLLTWTTPAKLADSADRTDS